MGRHSTSSESLIMKFQTEALLIGVVGKKGHGTLDNGQEWATDRIELHVATPFPDSDEMAHGSTCTVYAVADHDKNYARARACLDKQIILDIEMIPAKKLGAAPKYVCVDFGLVREPVTKEPNKSALPEGVKSSANP